MATETEITPKHTAISLTRQEAVNLIGLLVAQLGGTAMLGNMSGAAPEIIISEKGGFKQRLSFVVNGYL